MERWATFDCYGTLIDWNGGIRRELARVFGDDHADDNLARYHELEPELQADGTRNYREVLTEAMRGRGAPPKEGDAHAPSHAVPFELAIVASEIGSYKPAHRHWERFFEQTQAPPDGHVHVGASLFHDIAPANELGLRSVWINRLAERPEPRPTRELRDLDRLPETLDELVPAG